MRVERIEAGGAADAASAVMRASWPVPSLNYTAAFLRWQLTFPARRASIAMAAFEGDEMIGFGAATPRRVRFRDLESEAYLVSFSSVLPAWRGSRVAGVLVGEHLAAVRETGLPVIAFAEAGTAGERSGLRAYPSAGFRMQGLGPFPAYGCVPSTVAESGAPEIVEVEEPADILPIIRVCRAPDTIWNAPDEALLRHYAADPRPRAAVLLKSSSGEPLGAAMVAHAEIVSGQGLTRVPIVENVWLLQADARALRALCRYAGRRWSADGTSRMVSIPNAWGVAPDVLRTAGLRRLPLAYVGWACSPAADHPFLEARGTNLEIV